MDYSPSPGHSHNMSLTVTCINAGGALTFVVLFLNEKKINDAVAFCYRFFYLI